MAHEADAVCLSQQPRGHLAERDPRRRLAGRGALEDRPGVLETVLLHPDKVGMARSGPSQRAIAADFLRRVDVIGRGKGILGDRIGGHHGLPLGPLAIADHDRQRRAEADAMSHPSEEGHGILLEGHPRATTEAEPPPGQRGPHIGRRHLDTGRQPLDRRDQSLAMGLARGQPTQHARNPRTLSARRRRPVQPPSDRASRVGGRSSTRPARRPGGRACRGR